MAREVRNVEAGRLVASAGPSGIDGALALLERLGARRDLALGELKGAVGARGRALVACSADRQIAATPVQWIGEEALGLGAGQRPGQAGNT